MAFCADTGSNSGLDCRDNARCEPDLLLTASSLQNDRQPRVGRRPPAEAAKVSAIARDHDPSFSHSTGQDIVVRCPLQADFIDMNGVIAMD